MTMISKGSAVWRGDLASGKGETSTASGVVQAAPISWQTRANERAAGTSPEELLAAAHASCFSMALSARLGKNGTPPSELKVDAEVAFGKNAAGGFAILSSTLKVAAKVPGVDPAKFQELAADAKENCPVSAALKGNVSITLEARLT
jgi:lipoyl-dependent peroxiredoxin